MPEVELLAVLAGAVAAFVAAGAYYSVVGDRLGGGEMAPWQFAVELVRCLILTAVVAGLAAQGEIDDLAGGLALGLALWIGFPFVLWTGAMLHERTPFQLAALHGGDWLVKLLLVAAIVSVWQ